MSKKPGAVHENPYTPTADDPTTPDMWKPNESDLDGLVTSDESPSIARGSVTLGQSVVITGKIKGNEDLTIEGRVEGTIESKQHFVTIGPKATAKVEIFAKNPGVIHRDLDPANRHDLIAADHDESRCVQFSSVGLVTDRRR